MRHFPLSMPLVGILVFLLFPLLIAISIYFFILIVSVALYFKTVEAMKWHVKTGKEGMIGTVGRVMEKINPLGRIQVRGELWNATSRESIPVGEKVTIIGLEGLTAIVQKKNEITTKEMRMFGAKK